MKSGRAVRAKAHGLCAGLLGAASLLAGGTAAAAPEAPAFVVSALEAAVTAPGAHVRVTSYNAHVPPGCRATRAEIGWPVERGGRVMIRLVSDGDAAAGKACVGWASADVKLLGLVAVTTRPVRAGERLDGAVEMVERELPPRGGLTSVPRDALAARALAAGVVLDPAVVRIPGANPGDAVRIQVTAGALRIEQPGRLIACGNGRTCAALPSGRHVEGVLQDGVLLVEMP